MSWGLLLLLAISWTSLGVVISRREVLTVAGCSPFSIRCACREMLFLCLQVLGGDLPRIAVFAFDRLCEASEVFRVDWLELTMSVRVWIARHVASGSGGRLA